MKNALFFRHAINLAISNNSEKVLVRIKNKTDLKWIIKYSKLHSNEIREFVKWGDRNFSIEILQLVMKDITIEFEVRYPLPKRGKPSTFFIGKD